MKIRERIKAILDRECYIRMRKRGQRVQCSEQACVQMCRKHVSLADEIVKVASEE